MSKVLFRVVAAAITFPALAPAAWAQVRPDADWYPCGPHMMSWSGGGAGMFFGPLFMILLLGIFLVAAAVLVRWLGIAGARPHHPGAGRTALDILKERFARGEIDREEFEERRRVLGE